MSKHTRGSWTILPEEDGKEYIRIRGTVLGGRYKIANVHHKTTDSNSTEFEKREHEETYANAQLIAESPILLEACKRLIGSLGAMIPDADSDADIIFARAAIAKAEAKE